MTVDVQPGLLAIDGAEPVRTDPWPTYDKGDVFIGEDDLDDALALVEHFRLVMHGDAEPDEDLLGDAVALEGVARYPVRVKCALLSWLALRDCIAEYRETTAMGG